MLAGTHWGRTRSAGRGGWTWACDPGGRLSPSRRSFVYGMVLAPGVTRPVAAVFTALTAADFLQFAYAAAQEQAG